MPIISGGGGGGGGGGATIIGIVGPLTGTQATIDFTSGLTGYAALFLTAELRSTKVATVDTCHITLNGDAAAHYAYEFQDATNATVTTAANTAQTNVGPIVAGATANAGECGALTLWIPNASGTTFNKLMLIGSGLNPLATAATLELDYILGVWRPTVKAGVSRITLTPAAGSWDVGSYAALYGYAL